MRNLGEQYEGFEIIQAEELAPLIEMRQKIYDLACDLFGLPELCPEEGLNSLHKFVPNLSPGEFNERRTKLIKLINDRLNCGEVIYSVFRDYLHKNLGPDLLVQKNTNLVLQQPGDPNPSELHRDAPLNSCYEMVLWVPMVDCFRTKSMYMLSHSETKRAYADLKQHGCWQKFEKDAIDAAVKPSVSFGQALAFSATVLHGSEVNLENETRVSLNVRYKNLFSPSGLKNQLQFFKLLTVSDFVTVGADLEFDVVNCERVKQRDDNDNG